MKFLIRDDDTCAFTDPAEITKCYESIWDTIPIGLSVTPFRVPGNYDFVPGAFKKIETPCPLGDNNEIVDFLKTNQSANRVEALLHGYNHTMPKGLPEYIGGTDLERKTREGKDYLEALLECKIDTFVPPNNGIMRSGLDAIIASGLNLVGMPSFLRANFRKPHPENLPSYLRVKYFRSIRRMKYPFVLSFNDHKEVSYNSITPSQTLESLLDSFVQCQKVDGVFVAAIHYHAFDARLKSGQTLRQALYLLIERAENIPNIKYPTFNQLWND